MFEKLKARIIVEYLACNREKRRILRYKKSRWK